MTAREQTLDQIVAANLRRLRKQRNLSISNVAVTLGVGGHIVRDMERPRSGRPQREFSWLELVALCGVFDTNLFELVLPDEGVEVADARRFLLTDSDSPGMASYHPNAQIGRDGLGWRLFGVAGNDLTPKVLEQMASNLSDEFNRRISRLEELLGIGRGYSPPDPEIARSFDDPIAQEEVGI